MNSSLLLLCGTAASIGFVHTALGPDHYIPFIAMGKARQWSKSRLALITILCGLGHVASSIVLGLFGIWAGTALTSLTNLESVRGEFAAWALIAFGFVYFIWGLKIRHGHSHLLGFSGDHDHEGEHNHDGDQGHSHDDGASEHSHAHSHAHEAHSDNSAEKKSDITPWVLFVVFVLGPCEPLIPVLMYPAAAHGYWAAAVVAAVFCTVTLVTMTSIVMLVSTGFSLLPLKSFERYSHAIAGATICGSGLAVQFLGL